MYTYVDDDFRNIALQRPPKVHAYTSEMNPSIVCIDRVRVESFANLAYLSIYIHTKSFACPARTRY